MWLVKFTRAELKSLVQALHMESFDLWKRIQDARAEKNEDLVASLGHDFDTLQSLLSKCSKRLEDK